METVEALLTRRSLRNFTSQPVEIEKLELLLKAAMYAPSAANEQPWQFLLLTDRSRFPDIMKIHPYSAVLKTATAAILVCGDMQLEKAPGNWILDCSAATQNILLAAHAEALGAVWCGIYPERERMKGFAEMFVLPSHIIPFALVATGYPSTELPPPPGRFHKERIHYNTWQ